MPKNIVLVSTYDTECGIASYTKELAHALKKLGHNIYVFAEAKQEQLKPEHYEDNGVKVYRIWKRTAAFDSQFGLSAITKALSGTIKPDAVHFQHEFGLFPNTSDFDWLVDVPEAIVTFHTITDPTDNVGMFGIKNPWTSIAHTADGLRVLAENQERFYLVPHGVGEPKNQNTTFDHFQTGVIGLCPGFISSTKGHFEIVNGWARAWRESNKNQYLCIVGRCRQPKYQFLLQERINQLGLQDRIIIEEGFKSDDDMAACLNSADYIVLGGKDTSPYSASGQLAQAIGAELPVLVKDIPIYRSQYSSKILTYRDEETCAAGLKILMDSRVRSNFYNHDNYKTWDEVAKIHEGIYFS